MLMDWFVSFITKLLWFVFFVYLFKSRQSCTYWAAKFLLRRDIEYLILYFKYYLSLVCFMFYDQCFNAYRRLITGNRNHKVNAPHKPQEPRRTSYQSKGTTGIETYNGDRKISGRVDRSRYRGRDIVHGCHTVTCVLRFRKWWYKKSVRSNNVIL